MKKIILILITLTLNISVSYASFPIECNLVTDTLQTEEIKQYHYNLQHMGIDLESCKCISCRSGIAPLLSKPNILSKKKVLDNYPNAKVEYTNTEPNGNLSSFLSVLSALGAIVFAFLTLASGMVPIGNPGPFLILTLVSLSASILTGIKAKKMGAKIGKAFLGLGVLILGVLFLMLLFSF